MEFIHTHGAEHSVLMAFVDHVGGRGLSSCAPVLQSPPPNTLPPPPLLPTPHL
jgi:hypothetical protein